MWIPKVEEKKHFSHKCKNELVFEVKMQRRDACPHCGADLHVCKNCEYWDIGAHNQCREKITEYTNPKYAKPGPIGLQIHGGLAMKVEFRNIKVAALP